MGWLGLVGSGQTGSDLVCRSVSWFVGWLFLHCINVKLKSFITTMRISFYTVSVKIIFMSSLICIRGFPAFSVVCIRSILVLTFYHPVKEISFLKFKASVIKFVQYLSVCKFFNFA